MIHLFDTSRRRIIFPVNWANSVVRWIQGVKSPTGTIKIRNELNPGSRGSIELDVDIRSVSGKVRDVIKDDFILKNDAKGEFEKLIDGVSLVSPGGTIRVSEDWIKDEIERYSKKPEDLTHDDITDWDSATSDFLDSDDYDALSDAIDDVSDVVDGILQDYLTSIDIGVTVAAKSHTHGFITADGKLSNCQSAGCLVVTDAQGRITHSDSKPLAKDVADLVQQWIDNDRKIGGGTITHDKITDWDSATAGFLDGDDYDTLVDAIGELADAIADCLTLADVGVTVAEKNHTHTTANISDWGTATAAFLTDADLAGYATVDELDAVEAEIEALADIVGGILDDYATVDDLQDYLPVNMVGAVGGAAAYNHAHTTGDISDWSSSIASVLSGYAKTSDLAGYAKTSDLAEYAKTSDLAVYALEADLVACEDAVSDLADIVDSILADYVTIEDLDDYITTDQIPSDFLTAIASRKSGSFTFMTDIQFNGTALQKKTRTVTVTQGVITNIGTESGWSTWHTPTVITWA